ncbi:hypothetical protein QWY85_15205 [Neolewinella lacunae]|uniref:Tetratricopeptide repeat protein n=1 Tax=Neolewinella lacunae TaxID=1517758 RepID=A0A923T5W7_9BACT|nr:hypothetical protein [Neolewinella lacunae]MBC6992770.1 hypothetical protein [Neolewinella lacunae]MDN3636014.1 hypothetical protein [Neolewinella lacunae]
MIRNLCFLLSLGCGASLLAQCEPTFYGYQFLNPALVDFDANISPFYLAFGNAYREAQQEKDNRQVLDNVAEWHERYCEEVEQPDIRALIYEGEEDELRRLLTLLGQEGAKAADLPSSLRSNTFARHLIAYRCREVVEYLLFAKRAEPYVLRPRNAFDGRELQRVEMERLIDEGLDQFKSLESHYVRLRYAYQVIRLAHYLQEHEYVIRLYDYLMPKIEADPSIIYDWIEGHRAGALQALGDYPRAAYLFSRIFDRCPSKRQSAYESFKIRTDEEWRATSNLCANDHERAMLHVLRAQNGRAVVLEEMVSVYTLEPANRALEPLLMRELLELESDLLGLDFNPNRRENQVRARRPRPNAAQRLITLQAFVNKVVTAGNAANPEVWKLARGFIEMLAGDYYYARRTFGEVAAAAKNDSIRQQVDILNQVMQVLALDRVTDSVEMHYYDLLVGENIQSRYPDFQPMVNDKLEAVYLRSGQRGKAALLRYGFDALQKNPERSMIRELEVVADSILGNAFDKRLLANRVGPNARDDINDLLGIHYLQMGQWETALEIFQRIPTARRDLYGTFAPFEKQFHDRVNYSPSAAVVRYNKVDLLERLLELEDEARRTTNDTIAARNYFNIGLAHYNMSYYSYNWRMADPFRSATSAARAAAQANPDALFSHPEAPLGNRENFSMDRARYYFERALTRAPNREAAAEIIYYAAKTERNAHYAAGRPGGARPFTYFRLLRDEYPDTEFYEKAIAECRTFAWFAGR